MKLKELLENENLNLTFSDKQMNIDIGNNPTNHRTETHDGETIHIWDSEEQGVIVLDPTNKIVNLLTGWKTGFIEGGIAYDEEGNKININ